MIRFALACVLIAAGAVLVYVGLTPAAGSSAPGLPQPTPIGEPAWTHVCLGTDDEPPGCP